MESVASTGADRPTSNPSSHGDEGESTTRKTDELRRREKCRKAIHYTGCSRNERAGKVTGDSAQQSEWLNAIAAVFRSGKPVQPAALPTARVLIRNPKQPPPQ